MAATLMRSNDCFGQEPCKACPAHVDCPGIFNDNVTIVAPGYPSFLPSYQSFLAILLNSIYFN